MIRWHSLSLWLFFYGEEDDFERAGWKQKRRRSFVGGISAGSSGFKVKNHRRLSIALGSLASRNTEKKESNGFSGQRPREENYGKCLEAITNFWVQLNNLLFEVISVWSQHDSVKPENIHGCTADTHSAHAMNPVNSEWRKNDPL